MTDRDDSLDQSGQNYDPRRHDGQQHDVPASNPGGSTSVPRPANTASTGQPTDYDSNDSDATTVVPRTDLPAATDNDGSAGSVHARNSDQAANSEQAGTGWQDSGDATSSGRPAGASGPVSNPATSEYPATQHFHTPADHDSTQAMSQQTSASQQSSGQPYSPPQPTRAQAYGAVSDPYPSGSDSTDQVGKSDRQSNYPDTSEAAAAGYGSTQSGFFSPQDAQQPVRVEVKPASLRFGHNLAGGLLGIVLAAGAAALYVLVSRNHPATEVPNIGLKLALIGLAILLGIPGLIAGWAPAAAWFPGLILAVVGSAAVLSGWVDDKIISLSNNLFSSPALAAFVVPWALVGGWVLLLAGIGAQMARRSATTVAMDRIVHN